MNILRGHENEETAYVVADYPYGFRLRTSIRYWIETTKQGQRFCSQTLNPKTGQWNKPKKSTYSDITVLAIDESSGHVVNYGFSIAYSDEKETADFIASLGELTEYEKNQVKRFNAIHKTRKHITVTIGGEEKTAEQKEETKKNIGRLFSHYLHEEGVKV